MTATHVPVLAGELIELLDPQPGEIAVDCTFGGGGHARLVADRLGPEGLLIAIDRDPVAEERFAALAAEVPCRTRFIRAGFAEALAELRDEGVARRPRLHGPRHVARCRSTRGSAASPTPTTRRWTCAWTPTRS